MSTYQTFVDDLSATFGPALEIYRAEAGDTALQNLFHNLESSLQERGVTKMTPAALMIVVMALLPLVEVVQSDLSPNEVKNAVEVLFLSVLNQII